MNRTTITILILALICSCTTINAQNPTTPSQTDRHFEEFAAQLEEVAMCHHAIKAAHHDALSLDQNPYYRYIVYSPHKNQGANVYPIPERCKNLETDLILKYTKMRENLKAVEDKFMHNEVGITISDIATDAQFLTVVINKMAIEGDRAIFWEDRDKDIP